MIGVVVVLLLLVSQATAVADDPVVTQARIFLHQQKLQYKRNQLRHEQVGRTFEEFVNHSRALKVVGPHYMLQLKLDLDKNRDRLNQEARAIAAWKRNAAEQAASQRFLRDHGKQLVAQNQMLLAMLGMGGAGGGRKGMSGTDGNEDRSLTFTSEGHYLQYLGNDHYVDTTNGNVATRLGSGGVIDQKTGQFIPAH